MKNVDELYKNYYNAYKSDFDTNDELTEDKKKKFNQKQFEIDNKISKESKLELPKWIKVSEKRFNEILSTVTEAKNKRLKINVDGREITLNKVESLLKGVGSRKIDKHEFKENYNDIADDAEKILNSPYTRSKENMIKTLSLLKEIIKPNDKKTDEQTDTTNMPELESEESAKQRRNQQGRGLKILTPNQMLSRLTSTIKCWK